MKLIIILDSLAISSLDLMADFGLNMSDNKNIMEIIKIDIATQINTIFKSVCSVIKFIVFSVIESDIYNTFRKCIRQIPQPINIIP